MSPRKWLDELFRVGEFKGFADSVRGKVTSVVVEAFSFDGCVLDVSGSNVE